MKWHSSRRGGALFTVGMLVYDGIKIVSRGNTVWLTVVISTANPQVETEQRGHEGSWGQAGPRQRSHTRVLCPNTAVGACVLVSTHTLTHITHRLPVSAVVDSWPRP